jgi:methionyl-tRNA formyltransferase
MIHETKETLMNTNMNTKHTKRDRHVDALDEYHVYGVNPRESDFDRTTFEAVRTADEARLRGHREIQRVLRLVEGVEPGPPDLTHKVANRAEIASLAFGMGESETVDFIEYGVALGLTTRHVDHIRERLIANSP